MTHRTDDPHAALAEALFNDAPPPQDALEAKARRHAAQTVVFQALYGGNGWKAARALAKPFGVKPRDVE